MTGPGGYLRRRRRCDRLLFDVPPVSAPRARAPFSAPLPAAVPPAASPAAAALRYAGRGGQGRDRNSRP